MVGAGEAAGSWVGTSRFRGRVSEMEKQTDEREVVEAGAAVTLVDSDRYCNTCGYNIRGVAISGSCPECGAAVADSLRGEMLQYAGAEYLQSLATGLKWILHGILWFIGVAVVGGLVGIVVVMQRPLLEHAVSWVSDGLLFGLSIWIFCGYMRVTQPDPQFAGVEHAASARNVARIAAIVEIALAGVAMLVDSLSFAMKSASGASTQAPIVDLLDLLSFLIGLVWVVAFFVKIVAMVRHVMWLGQRVPDAWMVRRAKKYQWLLVVLGTVGFLAAALGPLIALILYWNLLDRMRKHLHAIIATGQPASLPGALG